MVFSLVDPGARAVFLAGTFNQWRSDVTPLQSNPGGRWSVEVALSPGTYEYRFVVDGQWVADPAARESVPNPFGGVNSVVRVSAPKR